MEYYNTLLNISMKIGCMLLENGAEIYRVEESMQRMLQAYGIANAQVYCVPTTIIATISLPSGENLTKSIRVRNRGSNFDKVVEVNALCRRICKSPIEPEEIEAELDKIQNRPFFSLSVSCIAWALVASTFTLIFGGNFFDAAVSVIPAVIVRLFHQLLTRFKANQFFTLILESFVIAALAVTFSCEFPKIFHEDKIIIGTLMNLVPGLALTNCIRDIIAGDLVSGIAKLAEVMLVGVSIALGTAAAISGGRTIWG